MSTPVWIQVGELRTRIDDLVEQVSIGYGEAALAQALHNVLDLVWEANEDRTFGITGNRIRVAIREGLEA